MSKKKIVGIVLLVPIIGFLALVAIGASIQSNNYCQDLVEQAAQSRLGTIEFMESNCLDNLVWLDENHPAREKFEQLAQEKYRIAELNP